MKRITILLLTVSMIAAAFMGCTKPAFGSSSADTNGNGLRDDVELKIMKEHYKKWDAEDYEEFVIEDHTVDYFGIFNGVYVFSLGCKYRNMHPDSNGKSAKDNYEDIKNEDFFSSGVCGTLAWYKNEIRSVLSLLDEGVLSEEDVSEIRAIIIERWKSLDSRT